MSTYPPHQKKTQQKTVKIDSQCKLSYVLSFLVRSAKTDEKAVKVCLRKLSLHYVPEKDIFFSV